MNITILNIPKYNGFTYLKTFSENIKKHKRFSNANISIISEDVASVPLIDFLGINICLGMPSNPKILKEYTLKTDIFIILSKTDDNDPDGYTFDLIHRIKDINTKARIIVECEDNNEYNRLKNAGATSIIRPTRTYPEILVRSVVSEKSEVILDKLISYETKYKILSVNENDTWFNIFKKYYNQGIPIGYISKNSIKVINPKSSDICNISSLLFLF